MTKLTQGYCRSAVEPCWGAKSGLQSSAVDLLQNFAVQARRASFSSGWQEPPPFLLGDVKSPVDDHLDK